MKENTEYFIQKINIFERKIFVSKSDNLSISTP